MMLIFIPLTGEKNISALPSTQKLSGEQIVNKI